MLTASRRCSAAARGFSCSHQLRTLLREKRKVEVDSHCEFRNLLQQLLPIVSAIGFVPGLALRLQRSASVEEAIAVSGVTAGAACHHSVVFHQ